MRESSSVPEEIKFRLHYLWIFIIISFTMLVVVLWYFQLVKGEELAQKAVENCIRTLVEDAPRGEIYDRNNKLLVTNRPAVVVSVIPGEVEDLEGLSERLGEILAISPREIKDKIKEYYVNPFKTVKIFDDCNINEVIEIEERQDELKGVVLEIQPRRKYLYQDLAAHSLGYVGEINREELERVNASEFQGGDIIGKAGLEKYYDNILRGEKGGKEVEVDALGREITTLLYRKPIPGKDIVLTIDQELQQFGENLLTEKKGVIIVSDANSGEIITLVSKPSYNPNVFVGGITPEEWKRLSTDPDYPLSNRSIQGTYSPGSTFKVVTAIAALEEGITDKNREIYCSGKFKLSDQVFKCWKEGGHGKLDIIGGISHSCNIYFYTLGQDLGIEKMNKYMQKIGFGEEVAIDLPAQSLGTIPSAGWKQREFNEIWYPGDTVNLSIGQGYLLITPFQLHNVITTIATEGIIYKYHLLKEIISSDGKLEKQSQPEIYRKMEFYPNTIKLIKEGLRDTILEGTGWRVNIKELEIFGKTGTAQNPQGETHAWFMGYVQNDDSPLCITVFIENGGDGSEAAAPIAREMIEKYFNIPKEKNPKISYLKNKDAFSIIGG